MTFVHRLLEFDFDLASGQFQGGGGNSLEIKGLRSTAKINIVGATDNGTSGTMEGAIFGMTLAQMNQLTIMGQNMTAMNGKNGITVKASNDQGTMTTIFEGHIFTVAYMDGQSQPQVAFRFNATADGYHRLVPAKSTSSAGDVDVATTMQSLAGQMGLSFENNGVNVKVHNPYLSGAPRVQAGELADAAGISMLVDKGKLAIWNTNQGRQSNSTPLLSRTTGMIGYPAFLSTQVLVKSIFKPEIEVGKNIQIKSDITAACGTWQVINIAYELQCNMPKGHWEQVMTAVPVGGNNA